MRAVKPEVRVLGVDDAPFEFSDETTDLVGVVTRGGGTVEGVVMDRVAVDGFDVTDAILRMLDAPPGRQARAVVLDGITYAGFNIPDLARIADAGVGVVAASPNEPDRNRMGRGLDNVDRRAEREELLEQAGEPLAHELAEGTVHFQFAGLDEDQARELLDVTCTNGLVPEPVRVAHMVAGALKKTRGKGER